MSTRAEAGSPAARSGEPLLDAGSNGDSGIVMVLPRGEAYRNFVYSGVIDELSSRAAVTALTVVPNEEIFADLARRCREAFPLVEIPEHPLVSYLREALETAHERRLWSPALRKRWRMRDAEATTPAMKITRLGKKLVCRPFANRPGLEILSALERAASRRLRTTDEYLRLYRRIRPALVFNGSHVHGSVAVQPVQAAQWLGIPTATFVFSWDNLTSQGRVVPLYDYYLVWSEAIRSDLLKIYPSIRPEQVFVTGTPQFDYHFRPEFYWTREEFCRRAGIDPRRPIVLYSTGMANHMPAEPLVVERIADLLQQMSSFGPPQLLVRVYPKDHTGRFEELKRRRPDIRFQDVPWEPKCRTPKLEDAYLLTNTLRHADVGLNVASTVSLELCMFDRPVVCVGYNPPGLDIYPHDYRVFYTFDHYRPVIESGAVALAGSEAELKEMIEDALANPGARSDQRKALLDGMFGPYLDGRCGARVAACLLELAARREARCAPRQPAVQSSRATSPPASTG